MNKNKQRIPYHLRLSPNTVRQRLRERDYTMTALANELSVTRMTVWLVVTGRGKSARISSRIDQLIQS